MHSQSNENPTNAYEAARAEVKKIKAFYTSLATYILINLFLLGVDLIPDRSWDWSYWVLFGWGIGLGFQAIDLFITRNSAFKNWEDKKIEEIMKRNGDQ
jgi:hypothetical protein